MSLQIASVIGNATKDAEIKVSKDGVSYVTFRVAVSGSDGAATFYNVVVFGHYGEVMKDHITRGRKVFVIGKLQISEKGYVSVVADHIQLLAKPRPKVEKQATKPVPVEKNKTSIK